MCPSAPTAEVLHWSAAFGELFSRDAPITEVTSDRARTMASPILPLRLVDGVVQEALISAKRSRVAAADVHLQPELGGG